jgi:hypothetical protein
LVHPTSLRHPTTGEAGFAIVEAVSNRRICDVNHFLCGLCGFLRLNFPLSGLSAPALSNGIFYPQLFRIRCI